MKGSERHRLKENELSHVLERRDRASAGESQHGLAWPRASSCWCSSRASDTGHGRRAARTGRRPCSAMPSSSCRRRWRSRSPARSRRDGAIRPCRRAPKRRWRSSPRSTTPIRRPMPALPRATTPHPRWRCSGVTPRPPRAFRKSSTARAPNSFYGRMARLGVVEANAQAKKYDEAITAAQALVNNTSDETIPRDALLMELGRVQAAAGQEGRSQADARQGHCRVSRVRRTSKRRSGCWRSSRSRV